MKRKVDSNTAEITVKDIQEALKTVSAKGGLPALLPNFVDPAILNDIKKINSLPRVRNSGVTVNFNVKEAVKIILPRKRREKILKEYAGSLRRLSES